MVRREFPEAPIVGVGAVVIDGTQVLLVRRGQKPLKGQWSLPGGALELGETLQQGVMREVMEETGLVVVPTGIVEVLDRITQQEDTGRIQYHYVLIDFICRVAGGTLLRGSDADEARFVSLNELDELDELKDDESNNRDGYRLAPITLRVIQKAFRMTLPGTA